MINTNKDSLPNGWEWQNIGNITLMNPKFGNKSTIPVDLEVQFLPMKLVEGKVNKIHLIETRAISALQKGSYTAFENGDLIFAKVTPCMENGKVAIVDNLKNGIGYGSSEFHVIRCSNRVLNKYLFHFIVQNKFRNEAQHAMTGAVGLRRVPKQFIETYNIPLPPISVQQILVAKIEELFSEIDEGIEQLKTARQQLKIYRQAVLKWAFQGKLTEARREENRARVCEQSSPQESTLLVAKEGNVYEKKSDLPEGWSWVKTSDVIHTINNGYTPTKEFLSEGSGEVPFIKVYNLTFDGTLNFTKNPTFIPKAVHGNDLKRSVCMPGDVLINIVGPPLGKVSVVSNQYPEWNINQAIVLFRPNEKVTSKYLSYFMQNAVTINWLENTSKATAGQWNVKVSTCREIPFPFCSIEEQNQIVQEIESRLSVADKMEESISQSLQQAEVLRQSILKKAFKGKLMDA